MKLKKVIIAVLFAIAGLWFIRTSDFFPSFKNPFAPKPVVIDETPILIKEIKSIGQLITYSALDEVVADSFITSKSDAFINSFNRLAPIPFLPSTEKHLVLIGRGKILAGCNLQNLGNNSVSTKKDTVTVYLPKAQILDAIVNPGDFETFVEKGDWTSIEVTLVKMQARRKMIQRALQQNILQKADQNARVIMEDFLKKMGYKYVFIY